MYRGGVATRRILRIRFAMRHRCRLDQVAAADRPLDVLGDTLAVLVVRDAGGVVEEPAWAGTTSPA